MANDGNEWESVTFVAGDGYSIRCRYYPPQGPCKGVIACLHGIQSHAGWYEQSCRYFAAAGFAVYFMDRRGSGANADDRGHCANRQQLCDDVERFLRFVKERTPGVPVILFGISWGGKLAVATIQDRPNIADALVLVGPGMFAKVSPTLHEKLAIGWSAFLWPRRKINIPLSDPALFTANHARQNYIRNDSLSLRQATARLLLSSKLLDGDIKRAPEKIRVPSLLVLAEHDRIIDNEPTRKFFERFAAPYKQELTLKGTHHTIEFEPEPTPIFKSLLSAMEQLPIFTKSL